MNITTLGEARFASPQQRTVSDQARVSSCLILDPDAPPADESLFELAGPRGRLFFDPQRTRAGMVTCGGLCPGLNNVIRSLFLELHHGYGVKEVLGFRGGYQGLDPASGWEPFVLTPEFVHHIHDIGGTVLGTSRGPVDVGIAVDNLIRREVNILFTIGGDGTQRGGNALFEEARRRGHALAVVGIPKTIDNDVPFVARSFGYLTAVERAAHVLQCAHTEAHSVHNGIALVKLMGRHSGFIAAAAAVASQDVNFVLVPEVPLRLDGENGLLAALKQRILRRPHALIAVAEGAGQELLAASGAARDASGNVRLQDIGLFLRERIERYFASEGIPVTLRYFDPSYLIRSVPADAEDAILCDFFARNAVHAAMAGKTGLVIGLLHDVFIHVPIELLVSQTKRLDLNGAGWRAVLAATGQTFGENPDPV
ncbi:ATP-dependent 6-phosphofructokinase [Accumulibacter sp.]|uniref:ATP-dependent 6-phosphofructokinase n=1 Tax=Accumulibacter sp. TaxID=2053492 RepID=UPI001AC95AE5|nr:ATP-dependent 6-phosphofructokinase [Accumulibacter sp.]MBN8452866.1 ATP-dependent 6-phosphofructokinase [Accumulibacter sp.]MBO3707254.1 ATP-dependent 6-phosphofructokinase [Candidatus Accumulibacter conexus]